MERDADTSVHRSAGTGGNADGGRRGRAAVQHTSRADAPHYVVRTSLPRPLLLLLLD